ncbi:MAG: hypothetical protein IPG64_26110 [Haliea sp.]|nr:hypothetical protein [Haliea sp.]
MFAPAQLPRPEALAAIERLSRDGVHVASGSGTAWQRAVVCVVLAHGLWFAVAQSLADPLFLWMLLPVLLVIDFLSGFVHWFFDIPGRTIETLPRAHRGRLSGPPCRLGLRRKSVSLPRHGGRP